MAVVNCGNSSVRALAKLEQVLPSRLRYRVDALHSVTLPLTGAGAGPPVDPAILTVLAVAARDRQRVRLSYTSQDGPQRWRSMEPHRLAYAGRRWYLLAWDLTGEGWRTFRVDRIAAPQIAGPRFTPREVPGGDAAAYVARSVSAAVYRYRARVRLNVPVRIAAERVPPTAGHLEPDGDDACILTTGAESLDTLVVYTALVGAEFEVLDPPELARYLLVVAARLTRAARSLSAGAPGGHPGDR